MSASSVDVVHSHLSRSVFPQSHAKPVGIMAQCGSSERHWQRKSTGHGIADPCPSLVEPNELMSHVAHGLTALCTVVQGCHRGLRAWIAWSPLSCRQPWTSASSVARATTATVRLTRIHTDDCTCPHEPTDVWSMRGLLEMPSNTFCIPRAALTATLLQALDVLQCQRHRSLQAGPLARLTAHHLEGINGWC